MTAEGDRPPGDGDDRDVGDEEDVDRDAILGRRQRLIAIALAGLAGTTGCDRCNPFAPCLSPPPYVAPPQPCLEPLPMPCLSPPEPPPQPCLEVVPPPDMEEIPGMEEEPLPMPCLSQRPPDMEEETRVSPEKSRKG